MSDQFVPFREVITYSIGGGWGFDEPKEDTIKVSVIRGTDMPNVPFGDVSTVPRRYEKTNKAEKRFLRPGDLILEIAGGSPTSGQSTGRSILITEKVLSAFASPVIPASFCKLMRVDSDKVIPLYTYYALQDMYNSGRAHDYEQQSTGISNFQFEYFQDTETLRLPPLPEQRAIAGILGALDDKIELNRRMNRTLESMARAVFREMMKDVEELGSILEFANLLSGGTPSTTKGSYWNGNIEWVSAKDVSNADGVFLLDTEKKITQAGIDNSATKLLPAKTIIVTARGTVGAHCMLGKSMTMNQTNYGLKAKEGIGNYFVYFTLSEMVEQLKQQSYGTIFDTITTKTFQSALCPQPSIKVIQKFEEQVSPMMNAILNNQKESRTLASLRDSLLPKLMRGEVRVRSEL